MARGDGNKPKNTNLTKHNGGGRPKGTPNKTTVITRECFAMLVGGNWHKMQGWLETIAKDEKTGAKDALDRILIMAEFCVPKLARTEIVQDNSQAIQILLPSQVQPKG